MDATAPLRDGGPVLAEGAVIERLRRQGLAPLDPHVLHALHLYAPDARRALAGIYREYLAAGLDRELPVLLLTPTWRASPERLARAGGPDCAALSREAVGLLSSLRDEAGAEGRAVIGGLMGPRGDAYDPAEGLAEGAASDFHAEQARALAAAGADVLLAATLPAAPEALGLARAMAAAGRPYLVSYVLRPAGTLLDGAPLGEIVARIDGEVDPPPLAHLANCVHPRIFAEAFRCALAAAPALAGRLVGLQANTSPLPPEKLDGSAALHAENPETFAALMLGLREEFGLRVLGGCCGTDGAHIRRLAALLAAAA
ncbi:MAG: homocysteine S-methyltransferase family protein [Candidatus Krumholzibacteriota bacterium]|nr:homocysteine S-methyltransferase family protein [Candidatus Krumholzibacteriota bacterium]